MKYYLIHYRPLKERLDFFDKQVNNAIEYEIIDDEESDVIFDIGALEEKKQYLQPYHNFNGYMPPISKQAEKSVAIKQVKAWNLCADSDEPGFIMEDDIIFDSSSCFKAVELIASELASDCWDIIMFGESCNLRAGSGLKFVSPPMTRGLSAYLLNPSFAKKIQPDLRTISMAVDWELNYLTVKHQCKMLWYEPILFGQGSQGHAKIFKSSIQE